MGEALAHMCTPISRTSGTRKQEDGDGQPPSKVVPRCRQTSLPVRSTLYVSGPWPLPMTLKLLKRILISYFIFKETSGRDFVLS